MLCCNDCFVFGSAWIHIDFGRLDPDPDPGGQKCPSTEGKGEEISSFEVLDVFF
jgi:hypothetical protein